MKSYLIDESQLRALRRAAVRLHTEDRMNGDEMWDLGHSVTTIADVCEQLLVPDDLHMKTKLRARPTNEEVGRLLSRVLNFTDRAVLIRFAKDSTIMDWEEVIQTMEHELRNEGRDPATGAEASK